MSLRVRGPALVAHGQAQSIFIECPIVGALQTFSVGPVPCLASSVGRLGAIGFRIKTGAIGKFISSITAKAISSGSIVGLADVTNGNAFSVGIESPVGAALFAISIFPDLAASIGGESSIRRRVVAGSVDEIVSDVASETISVQLVPCVAVIADSLANTLEVGEGSRCTGNTERSLP